MTFIQSKTCSTICAPVENGNKQPTVGKINGRSIAQVNSSTYHKKNILAGVGPGMFDGLGSTLFLIGGLFATVVATAAVGIATKDLKSAAITFTIGIASSIGFLGLFKKIDPKF